MLSFAQLTNNQPPWLEFGGDFSDQPDMIWRCTAAATNDVDQIVL